jgi:hypothetical protein
MKSKKMTTKKGDRVVMVVAILVIAASWATIGVKAAITAKAPAKKMSVASLEQRACALRTGIDENNKSFVYCSMT